MCENIILFLAQIMLMLKFRLTQGRKFDWLNSISPTSFKNQISYDFSSYVNMNLFLILVNYGFCVQQMK